MLNRKILSVLIGSLVLLAGVLVYAHATGGIALDGSAKCSHDSTCSLNLTTTTANDFIIVTQASNNNGNCQGAAPTDTAGLSFTFRTRANAVGGQNICEYYAISPNALSSDSITCSPGYANGRTSCIAFGVSGASGFDGNPCTNSGTSASPSCSLSSGPNDFIIGLSTSASPTTASAGVGFTTIFDQSNDNNGNSYAEYKVGQAGAVGLTYSGSVAWAIIGDALKASASTTTTSTTATSSTTTTTISSTCNSQCFFNAGSNINYAITNGGQRIKNLTVTMLLTSQINGISSNGGNWSLQVNGYAPAPYQSALLQWAVHYIVCGTCNLKVSNMFIDANYWNTANAQVGGFTYLASSPSMIPIASKDLTTGTQIQVKITTNGTGNVLLASFSVTRYDGMALGSAFISFSNMASSLKSPFVAFETDLVGYGGAGMATFSSATGTFLYESLTPLTWTSIRAWNLPYVESHAYTQETANDLYWIPQQEATSTISQAFSR